MKLGSFLSFVVDVSEKFDKCRDGGAGTLYYETLHMSLMVMLKEVTEEQYVSIPTHFRKTFEKLENAILEFVSSEYKAENAAYVLENGKFATKENIKKEENKMIKGTKNRIGFTADLNEGTTI